MDDLRFTIEDEPSVDEVRAIRNGLVSYNRAQTHDPSYETLALVLRDARDAVAGGLLAEIYWGWLHVEVLWVDMPLRRHGYGRRLLEKAEREAAARGCHSVYLDTFSFQAHPFYAKAGYEVFGTLEGFPEGHTRYFMKKALRA
jgi:GNAT superfamily N-acetyltransferase